MDAEGVIIASVAVIWGVILFFMRPQILEFSREGGKGLRNRKVINALVITAAVALIAGGIAIILTNVL
jgi:hypothetical protein